MQISVRKYILFIKTVSGMFFNFEDFHKQTEKKWFETYPSKYLNSYESLMKEGKVDLEGYLTLGDGQMMQCADDFYWGAHLKLAWFGE